LLVEVTATGEDAFLNQVAREIEEARAMKPGIIQPRRPRAQALRSGRADYRRAFVCRLAGRTPRLGGGPNVQRGAFAALAVLVLGYPCALGMATPLALIRAAARLPTADPDAIRVTPSRFSRRRPHRAGQDGNHHRR